MIINFSLLKSIIFNLIVLKEISRDAVNYHKFDYGIFIENQFILFLNLF